MFTAVDETFCATRNSVQTTGHGIVGGGDQGQGLDHPSAHRNVEFDWYS